MTRLSRFDGRTLGMDILGVNSGRKMKNLIADVAEIAKLREIAFPRIALRQRRGAISREVLSETVQALDFVAVIVAGIVAFGFYVLAGRGQASGYDRYGLVVILDAIIFTAALRRSGVYAFQRLPWLGWQLSRVMLIWAATLATLITVAFFAKVGADYSRGWAVAWAGLMIAELLLLRTGLRLLMRRWTRQGRLSRTVAIVGAGEAGEELTAKLRADGDAQIVIAGIFDDRLKRVPTYVGGCRVLGTTDDLVALTRSALIDEIIIALPLRAERRIGDIVAKLRSLPADLRLSIDQIGSFPMRGIGETASARTIEILDRPLKHWSGVVKWLEDQILGALCLVAVAPLMLVIALAIRLDSRGPILFMQERFGFNNKTIRVFKFRTMHVGKGDQNGASRTVRRDPRVTRVGRFLRRFSLDELPQLINVLRGEMSLVGPRPHVLGMKAGERLYHDAVGGYFLRHRVRPGMTGWAQVNGLRGEIDTLDKARRRVALDVHYIDNWSPWLDLKIMLMTIVVVFQRDNAY
jgi:Undecaprenyl-phosphate glucose phosphotransferase